MQCYFDGGSKIDSNDGLITNNDKADDECALSCMKNIECTHYSYQNGTCYLKNATSLTDRVPVKVKDGRCSYISERLKKINNAKIRYLYL